MTNFGWSLPPGCGRTPGEEDAGITELQEKVLGLLEDAGIDSETGDKVMKLIAEAEARMAEDANVDATYRQMNP